MPDYSFLLGAQVPQIPSPVQMAGQGLTLGNLAQQQQMNALQLQELQSAMQLYQEHPELIEQMLGGSGMTGMSPQELSRYGPGLMKTMPGLMAMAQKKAEIDNYNSQIAERANGMQQKAFGALANNAYDQLTKPNLVGYGGVLQQVRMANQFAQYTGQSVPEPQPGWTPEQHFDWLRSMSVYATDPKTQQGMLETDVNMWAKKVAEQRAQLLMNKPEIMKDVAGNYVRITPFAATPPLAPPPGGMPGAQPPIQGVLPSVPQDQGEAATDAMLRLNAAGAAGAFPPGSVPITPGMPPGGGPPPIAPNAVQGGSTLPQAELNPTQKLLMGSLEKTVASSRQTIEDNQRQIELAKSLKTLTPNALQGQLVASDAGRSFMNFAYPFLSDDMREKWQNAKASEVFSQEMLGPLIKAMASGGRGSMFMGMQAKLGKPGLDNPMDVRNAMADAIIADAQNQIAFHKSRLDYIAQHGTQDMALSGWEPPSPVLPTPAGKPGPSPVKMNPNGVWEMNF